MGYRLIPCINCGSEKHRYLLSVHGNRGAKFIGHEHRVVLCEQCGLGFLNPQHDEADYSRFYESLNYAPIQIPGSEMLRRSAYRKLQAAFLIDTVTKYWQTESLRGLRVLDVGCGPGVLLALLKNDFPLAEGLELGEHAASYAKREFGLRIQHGSVFDNGVPPGSFDIVVSTAAIEHFTDPLKAIRKMGDMLRPSGLLYLNTQDVLGMVLKNGAGSWFKFVHTYYFTEATLGSLIEQSGFEILRSWTMPPILKASLMAPHNFCSGELNIVAIKSGGRESKAWRGEHVDRIVDAYRFAQSRDRLHALVGGVMRHRYLGYPLRRWNRWRKPSDLFSECFDSDGNVKREVFWEQVLRSSMS